MLPCIACRDVCDLHTPYVFPQECSGRSGVRWLHLEASASDKQDASNNKCFPAITVAATDGSPFQMSVSPYSMEQLASARHYKELLPTSGYYHVHIDVAHMGVGGDDSWSPTVHPRYLVRPGKYKMRCCIQAVS